MDTIAQLIDRLNTWLSPWVYGPLVFLLWVLVLNILKRLLFSKIHKIAQTTAARWDSILIDAARLPLAILILGSGIYLLQLLVPLERKLEQAASILVQGSVVISGILLLDKLIREFGKIYAARTEFAFASKGILHGLVRGTVIGLGLLVFLDMIGISITPLLASLGIGSLAIGLALQDTLTNFFAGIYITIDKPVRVGDFIKLESGEEGYVIEVGWRSTRIRRLPNDVVIVPNQKLMSTIITNYYLPTQELAVLVEVGVHYDSDLKKVEAVTVDVAKEIMKTVKGTVPEFEPFIRYHKFDSSSINFTVILRAKEFVDNYLVKHEFIKALHERYRKEGIVIPYPMRTLHLPEEILETIKK